MIQLHNLKNYIIDYISNNNQCVIYIGVGTYFYGDSLSSKDWNYEENQQFPPFLHDFKIKNLDIPILIILIDPSFTTNKPPYIVKSKNYFYSDTWDIQINSNVYESNLNINVISISDKVIWDVNHIDEENNFNFLELLLDLCYIISDKYSNTLLFYHEFTGNDNILLENLIKKKLEIFSHDKICIDITRGSNMSCYFNLSSPEFYPIIKLYDTDNKLKYINSNLLTNEDKINIIRRFNNMNIELNINENNYLVDVDTELILYYQIIKFDKIIFDIINDGLIPLIRYLYLCDDNNNINNKMWGINHLNNLKYLNEFLCYYDLKYYTHINNSIDIINDNINLLNDINLNIESNLDYNDTVYDLKKIIINTLFDILENVIVNIIIKYEINIDIITRFIKNLKNLSNKYDMIKFYKNFISNLNIHTHKSIL